MKSKPTFFKWLLGLIMFAFLWGGGAQQAEAQCLSATWGQWPSTTFTPTCSGLAQTITTAGYASEYSKVNVTAGTTYTFTSSVATDFITISDVNGTVSYTFGVTPVVWVANSTQVIRFYTHTNSTCGSSSVSRTRAVMCPPPPPPANDLCADAIAINCGDVIDATTANSTNTGAPATACGTTLNTSGGVWYSFVGNGLPATVSLCGSAYDTKIGVFSGTCGALVCEGGNDDFCGIQSEVSFQTTNGTDYLIYVTGYGTARGAFTLSLSCVEPGMEIVNLNLDMGDRPIGAWMKPAAFQIVNNPGAGDLTISEADIDETFGGFLAVQKPALPYVLASGETTYEFGVKTTEAAITDGAFSGNFAIFYGGARAVATATYTGAAYTPVAGDVWENALDPNGLMFPVTVNQGSFRDNYDLPGATTDGWDVVYELDNTGMGDVLIDISVTGTNAKFAIYPAGFDGMGGPDMDNAIISGTTSVTGFEMFEGQYYLVVSSTGASFDLTIADAVMPAADAVTYLTPADGAINIENGNMLTWSWGGNTLEYQVVLGTTYPPATIVQDWTMANTAANGSYTLAGLNPNLQYFWQINTRNNNGTTPGDIWGFTTTITAPTALTVTVTDPAPTAPTVSATLNWTDPNRAFLGYNVYRDGVKINTSLLNTTTFTDLGLARNTTYAYYVTTVFDEGESAASNTVNITTKGVGTANGFVYDFLSGDPIEGAAVRVQGAAGDYNVQTSATGAYTTLAYAGTYGITVTASGYTSQSINGVIVSHAGTVSNDFYMMETPLPVGDVTAFELSSDAVQISWDGSGPEPIAEWLGYDDGTNTNNFGSTGAYTIGWAVKFEPAQLATFPNCAITKVMAFGDAGYAATSLNLKVWQGANRETLLYTFNALPVMNFDGTWTEIVLPAAVEFDETMPLWIGFEGAANGSNYIAAAGPRLDAAQVNADYLNYNGNGWTTLTNYAFLNYAWNLETYVTNAYGATMSLNPRPNDEVMRALGDAPMAMVANDNPAATLAKKFNGADRGIVDYTVWREKVYQPGVFEVIGNTTQMNFVDFDWGIQDWGVYRWAVTVNYEAGQVSPPTYSNPLDKDMETMVTVNVSLNSGEGPGGTSVTFTNMSEPDLELVYNTVLDNAGTFMWDAFRKGTYDIEVMLPGYAPITETGVDIFDESEFTWLLEEILAAPTDLYVTPTAYATWSAGSGGAPFVPFMQSFDGLANGALPDGWTKSPETANWGAYNSANAGGVAPEMRFNWSPSGTNAFYLMSPIMSTEGQTTLNFSFKQYINDYNGVYTLRVVTIADGVEHIVQEWLNPTDMPATDMSYTLTAAHGVGATDFQVAWVLDGYSFNINYWYIDDVMLNGSRAKAGRSFETYKVFLDGQLITETTDTEYQFGSNGETLVPYQTYTAGVAAVYSTGQSATSEFDFIYVPCDDYAAPLAFTAAQVEGTLDIQLDWTNVDAAALDTISAFRIYRNGEMYDEIDFTAGAVATYTDANLEFGMYTYCVTYIYDSGAETCQGVICSDEVEIDGNAMVDGLVMQAAYLGGDPIEGASVLLTNVDNTALTFEFFTDATGAYEGSIVAGTYDYVVSAEGYVSEMLDGVVIALNATVTNNFELMEFPYPPVNVVATELTDNTVLVTWNNPMYAPFEPVFTDFNGGIPSDWTVVNGGSTADTWQGVPNYSGSTLDGTPFAFVNSDAAGIGSSMDEMMYSPVVNALNANALYLSFDQYFNYLGTAGEMANVDVYDGTDWVNILTQTTDVGTFAAPNHQMIDVSMYANEMFQVRFHYVAPGWDWYWAVDNVMITDMATRTGVPFISQSQTPDRALAGYEVYRTTCATGDLQFLGYTLDTLFNDNTWGSAASGVYKWGVVAVYEENESEVVFSNCLDKDMVTQVSVTVSTNSLDSPEGTDVMFMNTSEPDLGLVYETTLDASGYFMWDEFRKGTYDIYVNLNGFEPVEIMGYVIDGPEDFVWVLAEQLLPVSDLYVTPTGFATWRAGGVIPFEMYMETFDTGLPADWTVVDGGSNTATWTPTAAYNGNSVDGTPFMFANSDAAGSGSTMDEMLISPVLDASTADVLYLKFDYVYQNLSTAEYFAADVFDGSDWVNVFSTSTDTGPFPWGPTASEMIDITEYANDMLQVRFHYFSPGWNWYVAVDNVAITDQEDTRALVNYKVWLDGIFVTDTPDTFWQYDVTNLVEGQEYFSEVAAVYTNGISAKMNYTWTYHSCEGYPGPQNLTGEVNGMDVTLTWGATAPPPPGGGIENDFETGSLGDGWTTVQTNTVSSGPTPAYWTVNDYVSADFSPFGTYHAGLWWDYGHQDEWLITPEFACPAGAELNFWSVVYLGSTYLDHYYVKVSTDGGSNWTVLWDASTLSGGWNYYDSPFTVDLSAYAGDNIKLAFQAIDGDGQGLWYIFFVDNVSVSSPTRSIAFDASSLIRSSNSVSTHAGLAARDGNILAKEIINVTEDAQASGAVVNHAGASKSIAANRALLYDNGPLVNSEGTGAGGADESILQNSTLGMTTLGAGIQFASGNHMADDFVVDATWNVDEFTFYGYQTNSGNTSTMTGGYLQIYDGNPSAGGTVIWGDMTTNRMTSTQFSNIYRISETTGGTARPVMEIVCETPGLTLEPGTYWVEYTFNGSGSSGPWAPPITITGQTTTGNAQQFLGDGTGWVPFEDGGTFTPQGMPFLINGTVDNGGGGGGGTFDPGPVAGVNVYRDGVLIAEMVQDTFYIDQDVDYGTYEYCVTYVYESGAESCSNECVEVTLPFPCDAPKELAGEYLWTEEAWGAMIEWNSPQDPVAEWLFYDDGTNVDGIGGPAAFTWAIKFDPAQLADFDGASLTKIQIYNRLAGADELRIYEGTNAATLLHTQTLSGLAVEAWAEVDLTSPVLLDVTQQLWIAVYTTQGALYPAGCGPTQNQPNGDLITLDGVLWEHLSDYALPYTWNLRGYVTNMDGVTAMLPMDKPADNYSNNGEALAIKGKGSEQTAGPVTTVADRMLDVFNVYRKTGTGSYSLIAAVPFVEGQSAYSYFDTDVAAQTLYTYQVTAYYTYANGTCESDPAMALLNPDEDFVTVFVTGANEMSLGTTRVYPNPATNNVVIESAKMNRITVMSPIGQVVYDKATNGERSLTLNTSTYEAGIYMIRIETAEGTVTKRLTVVR